MDKNMRNRMAVGAAGLLLAALVGAGGAVAATSARDGARGGVDETEAADAARVATTQVVSRRIVINGVASPGVKLLAIPGLGELKAVCSTGLDSAIVKWFNTTAAPVDAWSDYDFDQHTRPVIVPASSSIYVAYWEPGNEYQIGTQLDLGQGNSPGPRRTATISVHAYRSATGAPCGVQATATTWSTP